MKSPKSVMIVDTTPFYDGKLTRSTSAEFASGILEYTGRESVAIELVLPEWGGGADTGQ
jgi:hypothetical protein